MMRTLPVCAALLALPLVGQAAPLEARPETVIGLTVQPMPAPRPTLKYQLLPELREMNPGNPVQGYLKSFMEQNYFFFNQQSVANREKWQRMPLQELPLKELRNYGGVALRQVDYAARFDTPDWQILLKLKADGPNLLLPDVQQMRTLAAALKVRFRAQVAERHFGDAVATAKTLFALSRHLGEHPTLIGDLVGIAIAFVAIDLLEEMIQQPGCPNLYWALTYLPHPLLSIRRGLQGEEVLLLPVFALLDESAPMTDAQLRKAVDRVRELLRVNRERGMPKGEVGEWLKDRAKNEAHVRAARQRLAEAGLDAEKVKQSPVLQVILLDEKLTYELRLGEAMRALTLPYWQAASEAATRRAAAEVAGGEWLFAWLVPQAHKVQLAQARLEQRIALLRCVEALRLYAAGHSGRLPGKLADLEVPLPIDPITGKPFVYRRNGATATVRGTPPPGMEKNAAYNVRYEVTIRK